MVAEVHYSSGNHTVVTLRSTHATYAFPAESNFLSVPHGPSAHPQSTKTMDFQTMWASSVSGIFRAVIPAPTMFHAPILLMETEQRMASKEVQQVSDD